jgi:hypothetical protein
MPIPSEPTPPFKPVPAVSAACFSTECFGRCYLFMVSRGCFPEQGSSVKQWKGPGEAHLSGWYFMESDCGCQPTKSCSGSGNGPDAAEQDDHHGSQECRFNPVGETRRLHSKWLTKRLPDRATPSDSTVCKVKSWLSQFMGLCLPKMLSSANAIEISDLQEAETEASLVRRSEFNNVTLR